MKINRSVGEKYAGLRTMGRMGLIVICGVLGSYVGSRIAMHTAQKNLIREERSTNYLRDYIAEEDYTNRAALSGSIVGGTIGLGLIDIFKIKRNRDENTLD